MKLENLVKKHGHLNICVKLNISLMTLYRWLKVGVSKKGIILISKEYGVKCTK